jgi:hypothetical protein
VTPNPAPHDGVGEPARRHSILRELRSWPTLVLSLVCVVLAIPVAIALTPAQRVVVAGQEVFVGARRPTLSLSGPAQLAQIGNTELDIVPLRVIGPLRPRLTIGPISRNAAAAEVLDPARNHNAGNEAVAALVGGFVRWFVWATVIMLAMTTAILAVAGCARLLLALRQGRYFSGTDPITHAWRDTRSQVSGMAIGAISLTLVVWLASGALAYSGAVHGLQKVRSLSDLVGTYYLSPSPVGPKVSGYVGAVIGDSRASRVGGPVVPDPTPDDKACERSTDSLANEIGDVVGGPVLNLACPSASIARGLRGAQVQNGRTLPPQIGLLKQAEDLKFVVVVIGPNDLYWTDFLRYCYGVDNCQDRLTQGEFDYRLAAFDSDYGNLLTDLNDLPGQPQVIIVTAYDLFAPKANCPDARAPGTKRGISDANVALLSSRTRQLNDVLVAGATKYGFAVAQPHLTPLCAPTPDGLGPDIQGLSEPNPFHPTATGMLRMGAVVARVVKHE